MDDKLLAKKLSIVGRYCFVVYYELFNPDKNKRKDTIEKLQVKTGYTEKSCINRTKYARSIFLSNQSIDALKLIANTKRTRVENFIKEQAQMLIDLNADSNQKHNKS